MKGHAMTDRAMTDRAMTDRRTTARAMTGRARTGAGRPRRARRALGLVAAATVALGGCASMSKKDCLAGNWYERGYEDADRGETFDRLDAHAKACAKVGVAPDEAVYGTGYEAGLAEYCTPERGYELGSRDSEYRDICPFDTEAAFLGRYVDGLESAMIQRESDAIRAEAELERAVTARASLTKGQSTKRADGDVSAARATLDRLRGDRLGIREKIRRWNAELSAL